MYFANRMQKITKRILVKIPKSIAKTENNWFLFVYIVENLKKIIH